MVIGRPHDRPRAHIDGQRRLGRPRAPARRRGRRARGGIAADFDDDDAPLPPSRAVASRRDTPGGWSADDAPAVVPVAPSAPRERNSAPRGRPRDVPPPPDGDLAVPRNRHDEIERDVGELAEIPDLDDAGDAWDAPDELAAVPAYDAGTRVQTIGELDEAKGGFASRARPGYVETEDDAGDIDLSLLTSALIPAELVREDDEEWIPEKLWEQLKAELRAEEEAREEAAAERRAAAPGAPAAAVERGGRRGRRRRFRVYGPRRFARRRRGERGEEEEERDTRTHRVEAQTNGGEGVLSARRSARGRFVVDEGCHSKTDR